MTRIGRSGPPPREAAPTPDNTTDTHHSAGQFDLTERADEFRLDRLLVGERSLWAALFDGCFRLAVPCERCGRWLTAGASKRHRMGAHCRAKAATKAVVK